ncbi:MAG: methyltransferase [Bacteroidetes bacterium]|nr:methyltransferase [Bacteroidota bacterium]
MSLCKTISIKSKTIELFVPENDKQTSNLHSPFWAKVWSAAIGLCYFLEDNPAYFKNKTVLEIGAGLGLPSLFIGNDATHITANDIEPEAMKYIAQSAQHNNLLNIDFKLLHWKYYSEFTLPNTLLLSDINYEPEEFPLLIELIQYFLKNNTTIILSTPQRLLAKPFINAVQQSIIHQEEVLVSMDGVDSFISIFVFENN